MFNEFILYKRLLFATLDFGGDMTKSEINDLIYDTACDAYEKLEDCEKDVIDRQVGVFMDYIPGIGVKGALELLAAISNVVIIGRGERCTM